MDHSRSGISIADPWRMDSPLADIGKRCEGLRRTARGDEGHRMGLDHAQAWEVPGGGNKQLHLGRQPRGRNRCFAGGVNWREQAIPRFQGRLLSNQASTILRKSEEPRPGSQVPNAFMSTYCPFTNARKMWRCLKA